MRSKEFLPVYSENLGSVESIAASRKKMKRWISRVYNADKVEILAEPETIYASGSVCRIKAKVNGKMKNVYLKNDWSSNGLEAYALAFYNLVSDDTISYTAFNAGKILFLEEVHGKEAVDDCSDKNMSKSFGKAEEYADFLGLADRKENNVLVHGKNVANIDFGTPFYNDDEFSYNSIYRKIYYHGYGVKKAAKVGRDVAKAAIKKKLKENYKKFRHILNEMKGMEKDAWENNFIEREILPSTFMKRQLRKYLEN
ncbi:MAG: hypothetical protein HZB68_03055 [Candidatus Aenigmarchaeota archaeon]|nr:hypothetical protein [Candidatus Aenigmarchaeota archaeon]